MRLLSLFLIIIKFTSAYNSPVFTHNIARDNFKLVPYFAQPIIKKHKLRTDQCNELIQEGYIGLMYAARKYDPDNERRAKFCTYSSYWIKSYMTKYIKTLYNNNPLCLNEDVYVYEEQETLSAVDYPSLNTMEMDILYKRYVKKPRSTTVHLAKEYNISRRKVLSISEFAIIKLRTDLDIKIDKKRKYY